MPRNDYIHVYCSNHSVKDTVAKWNLQFPQPLQATQFELNTVCFDHTFYNINTQNSYIIVKKVSDGSMHPISIPVGNYDTTAVCTALAAAINAEFGTSDATVTVNPVTSKISIGCPAAHHFYLQGATMQSVGAHLLGKLGFPAVDTTVDVATHIAPSIYNLSVGHHLNVYCPQLMGFGSKSINVNKDTGNFLARVPITQYSFGEQGRIHLDMPFTIDRNSILYNLDFEIRMDDGSLAETNGGIVSMHLVFHTHADGPMFM